METGGEIGLLAALVSLGFCASNGEAKRKVAETWRDAVGRRAGGRAASCLARFDEFLEQGLDEGEAAYRALDEAGLLWIADEPGSATPPSNSPDDVPAV